MYGFHSAFTISFPVFPNREIHSFISFYFYTLTEKDGFEGRPFLMLTIFLLSCSGLVVSGQRSVVSTYLPTQSNLPTSAYHFPADTNFQRRR